MNKIRWKLFMALSRIGWTVCPEPQRSDLLSRMTFDMPSLDNKEQTLNEMRNRCLQRNKKKN